MVPDADEFSKYLGALAGAPQVYPLNTMAHYFQKAKGEHMLVEELLNCFTVTSVSASHREIASVPWRRVYTTNYDNCFERAASEVKRIWTPISTDVGVSAALNRVVHINGHIFNLEIGNLDSQIKLTHSSYSIDNFQDSQWSQQLRQDFDAAKAVVFIGYSLADLDVSRILRNLGELRNKTVFIVSPNDDAVSNSLLEDYGRVFSLGIDRFAELCSIVEPVKNGGAHEYTWLRKYIEPQEYIKPRDKDCFNLLTKGILKDEHLGWSLSNDGDPENNYAVKRDHINFLLKQISDGVDGFSYIVAWETGSPC